MVNFLNILKKTPKKTESDVKNFTAISTTGTEIFAGEFFEEYLQEIRGQEWAFKADEMRRSSDQVSMLLNLIKTPIINATWDLDYNVKNEQEQKIYDFTKYALFELIDFKQFLQESLTFLEFGHSVFEVVYRPLVKDPLHGDRIAFKNFSFISPKTISRWNVNRDSTLNSIEQQVYGGDLQNDVIIDANKLLVFTIDQEGANFEGISKLRPIYGNWKRKQSYLKLEAMGIERSAMGTPIGKTAKNAQQGAIKKLSNILSSFTSHQRSNIVVPEGTEIENFDLGFKGEDVREAIKAERLGMSQSFLAGFMELGNNSGSGSFALSKTLLEIFLGSIQIYADKFADKLNRTVLRDLIDINFGKQDKYPKLKASNISDRIGDEFTKQIVDLTSAGYLTPTEDLKVYLHKKMNLPEAQIEEEEAEENIKEDTKEPEVVAETNLSLDLAVANKNQAVKLIKNDSKSLESIIKENLTVRRDKLLESTRRMINNKESRKKIISQKLPNEKAYRDILFDFLVNTSVEATQQAKNELNINIELADKEELNKLLPATKERLRAEIDLIANTQESDLTKSLFFPFNNNYDKTDSTDKIIEEMRGGSDRYLNGASVRVGANNFVSSSVNNARNDVFQSPEVFDEIESFTIVNPSPEAAICRELTGRTITPDEYKTGDLPPYHHNCNTIVVANPAISKRNPKVSQLGLAYTGTPDQVEKIIKSRTL